MNVKRELKYEERAIPANGSYFVNWDLISTLPRNNGHDVPLSDMPFRIDDMGTEINQASVQMGRKLVRK